MAPKSEPNLASPSNGELLFCSVLSSRRLSWCISWPKSSTLLLYCLANASKSLVLRNDFFAARCHGLYAWHNWGRLLREPAFQLCNYAVYNWQIYVLTEVSLGAYDCSLTYRLFHNTHGKPLRQFSPPRCWQFRWYIAFTAKLFSCIKNCRNTNIVIIFYSLSVHQLSFSLVQLRMTGPLKRTADD